MTACLSVLVDFRGIKMTPELDYLVIGITVGIVVYWVGYYMGHRAGMRAGAWIASVDPNAKQWWR